MPQTLLTTATVTPHLLLNHSQLIFYPANQYEVRRDRGKQSPVFRPQLYIHFSRAVQVAGLRLAADKPLKGLEW